MKTTNKKDVAEVLANSATSSEPTNKAYSHYTRIRTRAQAIALLEEEKRNGRKNRSLCCY